MMENSGHDVAKLLSLWEGFEDSMGWQRKDLGRAGDFPVFALSNERASQGEAGGLYISTGVHGDECAPPWALLNWISSHPEILTEMPLVLIPCFNPVGLVENTRSDGEGIDLNRSFQNRELPLIAAWQDFLAGRKFRMALNLHEDYDAAGIYLYEIADDGSPGDSFLEACQGLIPRETAESVDG
ncbi:MAG: succinylglutamate desuccinylase/aspartoacylase family protein [Verrucomicrobiota bacterium]